MYKGHQTPLQIYRKIPIITRNIDDKTFNKALVGWFLFQFYTYNLRRVLHEARFFITYTLSGKIENLILQTLGKKGSPDFVHPARDVFPPCYRVKWKGRSTLQSNSQELCLAFRSTLVQPLRMRGHRNNERGTAVRCVNKGWKWHDTSLKKFTGGFKTHTTALNRSTWSLD